MALPLKMLVRDLELEVTVDPSRDGMDAWFKTDIGGKGYSSKTWNGLYKTLMTETKRDKVRVRVPYMALVNGAFVSGVAVGIHGGSNNIEVEAKDHYDRPAAPRQLDNYTVTVWDPAMTEAEKARRLELEDRKKKVQGLIDDFDKTFTFRLRDRVRDAIEKVVAEPDEVAS